MNPRIEILNEKLLTGLYHTMSLSDNTTGELWRNFMIRLKELTNRVSNDLISMQLYNSDYFVNFNPENSFVKWAVAEVSTFDHIPPGMDAFTLPGGLYAVFEYKGASNDNGIFRYIFSTWLPNSDFELDNRPHFEVLGAKYRNADPASEEEIWIPIQPK
jgi:AraC family transcriptional regulator